MSMLFKKMGFYDGNLRFETPIMTMDLTEFTAACAGLGITIAVCLVGSFT